MRLLCFLLLVGLALGGCSGPASATDGPSDEREAGRKLYIAKCAKCHKFYDPLNYSDEEWHTWMRKMSKKAKLKPEQEQMLSRYIDENLRTGQKTNNVRQKQ